MTRRLLILILLLGLVGQSLGSAIAGWSCEGRDCSSSFLACCCASPTEQQDGQCAAKVDNGKPCVGKCGCQLNLKRLGVPAGTFAKQKLDAPIIVFLAVPALLPPAWELPVAPTLAYAPVLPNPPPGKLSAPPLASAALRAPPVSFA